jgi:hypothetical protein
LTTIIYRAATWWWRLPSKAREIPSFL